MLTSLCQDSQAGWNAKIVCETTELALRECASASSQLHGTAESPAACPVLSVPPWFVIGTARSCGCADRPSDYAPDRARPHGRSRLGD
jgi:hypothetical protein